MHILTINIKSKGIQYLTFSRLHWVLFYETKKLVQGYNTFSRIGKEIFNSLSKNKVDSIEESHDVIK